MTVPAGAPNDGERTLSISAYRQLRLAWSVRAIIGCRCARDHRHLGPLNTVDAVTHDRPCALCFGAADAALEAYHRAVSAGAHQIATGKPSGDEGDS